MAATNTRRIDEYWDAVQALQDAEKCSAAVARRKLWDSRPELSREVWGAAAEKVDVGLGAYRDEFKAAVASELSGDPSLDAWGAFCAASKRHPTLKAVFMASQKHDPARLYAAVLRHESEGVGRPLADCYALAQSVSGHPVSGHRPRS